MWCLLTQVPPIYEVQSIFSQQATPAIDHGSNEVDGILLCDKWLEGNGTNKPLPNITSGTEGRLLMSSELTGLTGFTEPEDVHLNLGPPTRKWEERLTAVSTSTLLDGGRKAKRTKQRLACQYAGCKSTFPRPYELSRHMRNVHERDFTVCCFVFECRRTAKPFHREDKFNEHLRKHHNPSQFVCVIDSCGEAPLSFAELYNHIRTIHDLKHCNQPHLDSALVHLRLRQTRLRDGSVLLEENNMCPLAFLGCKYRNQARSNGNLFDHLIQHDILERSKGYEAIVAACGKWPSWGAVACPICCKKLSESRIDSRNSQAFLSHMACHSDNEVAMHAADFFEMLRPYLVGKVRAWTTAELFLLKVQQILEEEGVIYAKEGGVLVQPYPFSES